jgi:hypothetical protein
MAQEISGVEPGSDDYTHEVVLNFRGRRIGLKLLNGVQSVRIIPPGRQPPPMKLEQNSFHLGRGAEVWTPNASNFYDSSNAWTSTPNKLHPALLMQWATGFRDAEMNMPASGDTHKWLPLYPGSGSDANRRYQDVSFTASATSNRERCFLIIRKKGTPGTLTLEWCTNSGGNPNTVSKTVTKTSSDVSDITSIYMDFKPSSVLAVTSGTVYHIKVYGAADDTSNNCWEVLCDSAVAGLKSADNSSWTATTYSPYYRITDADVAQRIFPFAFDGAWYAVTSRTDRGNSRLFIMGTRGRATSASTNLLADTGAGQYGGTWTSNMWTGYKVRILRGTGQGQVRAVLGNNTDTLQTTTDFDVTPDATSEYVVYGGPSWKEITGHGLGWVSGRPAYANGTVYFPQNDTVDIRIMQLNYANANDHGFDAEDTNHNRAWFLCPSYESTLGPVMIRANQVATSSGNPDGKAVSIGRAPTSPSGTPVAFGTDLAFQTAILTGDNTYRITGVYDHQNQVYVTKEDVLFNITGQIPVAIKYGADASPNPMNGAAACTGMDGQFYLAANHDVVFISGSNSYPTNLPFNLPSSRSGHVRDMCSQLGWLFAAVDAGDSGYSSVMRMTLQDRSWHEQIRGFAVGRRIRSVSWVSLVDARPQLVFECQGELLFQEMPLYGVRPIQDSGCAYQHEAVVELATIDLLSTDPKYFSFFALDSKKLANANTAAVYGREVAIDYQLNDNIAGTTWINAGSFGISPQDKVQLHKGSQMKIRPRLRIENNQASNPPIVENLSLSLFSKTRTFNSFMMDINAVGDDELSGEELYDALMEILFTADVVTVESIFDFMHNKQMIISVAPNVNIASQDPERGFDGQMQLYMEYLPT